MAEGKVRRAASSISGMRLRSGSKVAAQIPRRPVATSDIMACRRSGRVDDVIVSVVVVVVVAE